jgi:hypothetical protein
MNAGDFDSALFDLPVDDPNASGWMDWMNPTEFGLW